MAQAEGVPLLSLAANALIGTSVPVLAAMVVKAWIDRAKTRVDMDKVLVDTDVAHDTGTANASKIITDAAATLVSNMQAGMLAQSQRMHEQDQRLAAQGSQIESLTRQVADLSRRDVERENELQRLRIRDDERNRLLAERTRVLEEHMHLLDPHLLWDVAVLDLLHSAGLPVPAMPPLRPESDGPDEGPRDGSDRE